MSAPVRVGLLGCADVATRRMLPALTAVPGAQLVAAASRSLAKAEAVTAQFGGQPLQGYQRLLERPDVDAVYVPLPSGLHAEWVGRALAAGKHVLAEKPLTTRAAQTRALVDRARASGLVLRENYMFVHHDQHRQVRRLVEGGAIGELRAFSATFAIPPRPAGDIRLQPGLGGGALLDVGGYPLRAAQLMLGRRLDVAGAALRRDGASGVDLGGAVLVSTSDGVTGALAFGLEDAYLSCYQLLGSTARLSVHHAFTPPATHRPVVLIDRPTGRERLVLSPDDQWVNALTAFVRAVRDGPLLDDTVVVQAELVECSRRLAGQPAGRDLTPPTQEDRTSG